MTNSNQSNKRAVTRFAAIFICMILVCGIALPFICYATSFSITVGNNLNSRVWFYGNLYSSSLPSYSYPTINVSDNVLYNIQAESASSYLKVQYRVGSTYYDLSTDVNNPTLISTDFILSSNTRGIYAVNESVSRQTIYYLKFVPSGYTLSFDSQGGSSISPLTGVSGIVHLGESGQYYPQYVPTRDYYVFQGWSLTQNGTLVWDVDVQADTTLYAVWTTNPNNCQILTDDHNGWVSYYRNTDMTTPLPSLVIAGENVILPVYVDISNAPSNQVFTGINVEYNNVTTFYPNDNVQHYFQINVYQAGYLQIYSVFEEVREFQIAFNPSGDGNNTMQFATYENYYPAGSSVRLSGTYSFPMFITNLRLVGDNTNRIYGYPVMNDLWDEQEQNFFFTIDFTMPDENCTLTIFWSEMAGAHVQPSVSYDESGEAYFIGVSEEPFWNQDFSSAKDLIPQDFVGVVEYFGNLQVLSLVITIIMVAGFTAYLLRRQ